MGEASTPLLNMRWFMIKLGQGHTTLFRVVEICFLLIFVVTRFFIYAAGLGYQLLIIADMPAHVPNWAVNITMGTVCAGFVLNLVWLGKMWRLAKGGGRKRREAVEEKANGASDKIE